jgi:hypothetical protein
MPQTVRWKPATAPNIVAYVLLYSDTGMAGPFLTRAQIVNAPVGDNYDPVAGIFFYNDDEISYRLYRLRTIDVAGNVFDDTASAPFSAGNDPYQIPVANTTPINENYGGANALQYVTQDGIPVVNATVRVYTKLDWDLKRYSKVIGLTKTNENGGWVSPIFVEPGNNFVVHFTLPNVYGPDTVEITV